MKKPDFTAQFMDNRQQLMGAMSELVRLRNLAPADGKVMIPTELADRIARCTAVMIGGSMAVQTFQGLKHEIQQAHARRVARVGMLLAVWMVFVCLIVAFLLGSFDA